MGIAATGRSRGADRGAARRRNRTCAAMSDTLADRFTARGLDWIVPAWPGPARVRAFFTTRNGGASSGANATLDLGPALAIRRRPRWRDRREPAAHRRDLRRRDPVVARASARPRRRRGRRRYRRGAACSAAARRRRRHAHPGIVLAVRTADCLPVLLAARDGSVLAVAHAGWRGLAAGVLEAAVTAMDVPARGMAAWIGPAIGPSAFEVGAGRACAHVAHRIRARARTSWPRRERQVARRSPGARAPPARGDRRDGRPRGRRLHVRGCAALPLVAARPVERAHGAAGVARAGMTPRQ